MLQHVFDHVEYLASIDAKHGTRLRMENYLALQQGIQVLLCVLYVLCVMWLGCICSVYVLYMCCI